MEMKFNIKFNCVDASTNELESALRERCTQVEIEEDGSTLYFNSIQLQAVKGRGGCVSDKHFVLSIPVDVADGVGSIDGVSTEDLETAIRNRCSQLELDDGAGTVYLNGVQVEFEAPPPPTPAERIKALEIQLFKAESELQNIPVYRWEAKLANDILSQARRAVSWLDHANCVLPDDGENGSMRADLSALRALLPTVPFDEAAQSNPQLAMSVIPASDSGKGHAELSPFITVPAVTFPDGSIEPSFKVGRYLCSKGPDGRAVIDATLAPWVNIPYADARAACIDAGFNLITERQALAIARDISSVPVNWTGGMVGFGLLAQGLRKSTVDSAQPGDFVPADVDEQRWFTLSNGERICDAAGNACTWVFDNVQGDAQGLETMTYSKDSISLTTTVAPSMRKGAGRQPMPGEGWPGVALVRGGSCRSWEHAGVFHLSDGWPAIPYDFVGFRSTL